MTSQGFTGHAHAGGQDHAPSHSPGSDRLQDIGEDRVNGAQRPHRGQHETAQEGPAEQALS